MSVYSFLRWRIQYLIKRGFHFTYVHLYSIISICCAVFIFYTPRDNNRKGFYPGDGSVIKYVYFCENDSFSTVRSLNKFDNILTLMPELVG